MDRKRTESMSQNSACSVLVREWQEESVWCRQQMNQGRLVIWSTEKRSNKMADSSVPVSLLFFRLIHVM